MLALVGLGYWGPNLLRNFNKLGVLKAAFDLDDSKLEKFELDPRYRDVYFGTDWEVVLGRSDIKGVVIATPPETHYALAKKALLNNKHVFVEKPLTTKVSEAENLVKLAKSRNLVLMVGHTFLYSPEIRKIKEFIDLGLLGDVLFLMSSRLNLGKFQSSGVINDLLPHDISIANYLLGTDVFDIKVSSFSFINKEIDELAFVNLVYENGVVVNLAVSWLYPIKERRLVVVGTKRMLIYNMMAEEKIKVYDKCVERQDHPDGYGEYLLSYRHGDTWSPDLNVVEPLYLECVHFIECINNNIKPFTDGLDGLNVVKVLEQIRRKLG